MSKVKVVFNLSGEKVPFLIPSEEEIYYVNARDMLNEKLIMLQNKYAASASLNQMLTAIAVEALVDGLKANERYKLLKTEINNKLELFAELDKTD